MTSDELQEEIRFRHVVYHSYGFQFEDNQGNVIKWMIGYVFRRNNLMFRIEFQGLHENLPL
ncbi:hypothetical protein BPIT_05950 [Candidatus Brocadia pituitae]|nr:hypothetical protein BPIT_05950 [Candidatus Brocadia pituitae]